MNKIREYLEDITEGKVILNDTQLEQFDKYYEILIEKNTSGIPSINIIIETDNPLILLKTTDRPLSPPGAIV